MKKWMLGCITLLLISPLGQAGEPPAKAQTCVACHGKTGVSNNPEWPNLAGQQAGYLAVQLRAFRDGQRANPAMAPFVNGLTDAEIDALAAFYAAQKPNKAANGDTALVATGENLSAYCKSCHGMQGKPVAPTWPNLSGQHAAYLQKQLVAFKSGARENTHMQVVVKAMADPQFAALAAYYSQLTP